MIPGKTRRYKVGYILILVTVTAVSFSIYKNYSSYKLFCSYNNLNKSSIDLSSYSFEYMNRNNQEDLTNSVELSKMVKWIEQRFSLTKKQKSLLENGYVVKYIEDQNLYLFCLYGGDKKLSLKNISLFDNIKKDDLIIVQKPSFIEYYFNCANYDVILFAYFGGSILR